MAGTLEYQVYPEEYFSGCDVSVYFGDAWIDEIVSINFALMEYVQPVFGYNSYVYDAVARGSRLVSGTFRINFRESFYLHKIIEDDSIMSGTSDSWNKYAADRIAADKEYLQRNYLEITLANEDIDSQMQDKSLEDMFKIAKAYQNQAWDKPTTTNSRTKFFDQPARGFEIIIMYGSKLSAVAGRPDYHRKFDIPPTTNYVITGVQLTSVQNVITPDGTPVYEDYTFIARDLIPRSQ